VEDLRDMGESNAVVDRRSFLKRDTLCAASAIYKELHGLEDGNIPATFQVIYMVSCIHGPLITSSKAFPDWVETRPKSGQTLEKREW